MQIPDAFIFYGHPVFIFSFHLFYSESVILPHPYFVYLTCFSVSGFVENVSYYTWQKGKPDDDNSADKRRES